MFCNTVLDALPIHTLGNDGGVVMHEVFEVFEDALMDW